MLLQGPSNFERLAVEGRLPAALEVIHRQMAQPGGAQLSERQEQALATLIASGAASQLSHALLSFLWCEEEPSRGTVVSEDPENVRVFPTGYSPPPEEGFALNQRTRDGPKAICVSF